MSDILIKCEGVSKKFSKSLKMSMLYGGLDILQNIVGALPDSLVIRQGEFLAVDQVSFELRRGQSLGIIGANGCGKTTLLKMLNGIYMPDKGKITVKGKIGGLIQVGAGFHPMLSGRENIYINGAILGMKKKEIDQKLDSIIDFADIGDFLESPVKFYSSGMYVRLGFAIAAHSQPDVLLVDEVLAVGDLSFQSKCLKFMTSMIKNGCSVVFVSHNRYAIEDVCQEAIYLKKGKPIEQGKVSSVIARYLHDIKQENVSKGKDLSKKQPETGITKIAFLNEQAEGKVQFRAGEKVRIRFYYSFKDKLFNPSVAITFIHDDPRFTLISSTDYIFNLHSGYDNFEIESLEGNGYFEVTINCLYMPVGIYKYSIYLYSDNKMNLIQKYEHVGEIEVLWFDDTPKRSLIELPHQWAINKDVV